MTRRRTERLQALTAGLSGALTSGDVGAIFIDEVIDAIGADAAALSVADPETGQMHPVAWRGVPDELIEERGVPLRPTAPGPRRFAGGGRRTTGSVEHLAADFPRSRERAEASGMQTFAYLPLSAAGSPVGLAVLGWREPDQPRARRPPVSRGDRRPVRSRARPRAAVRDRARHRGDAATKRAARDPPVHGRRARRRALPSRLDRRSTSAATGSTRSRWRTAISASSSATSSARASKLRRPWPSCETGCARSRSTSGRPARRSRSSTSCSRAIPTYRSRRLRFVTLDPHYAATQRSRSAGHPPPLVVGAGRRVRYLEGGGGLPLGADPDASYTEWHTTLEPGAIVVLYTDGLVERPDRSIDEGLDLLAAAAAAARRGSPTPSWTPSSRNCSASRPRGDDVALLAIRPRRRSASSRSC